MCAWPVLFRNVFTFFAGTKRRYEDHMYSEVGTKEVVAGEEEIDDFQTFE